MMKKGFLAVWCDVVPLHETEWNRWYSEQHVPERVAVPGFLTGRRYRDAGSVHHRYLAWYETEGLDVLDSPAYRARLDDPTEWTRKMMPSFRNFVRGAGSILTEAGVGTGGALLSVRIRRTGGDGEDAVGDLSTRLQAMDEVVAVRVGVTDAAVTAVPTRERSFRGTQTDASFDACVLVEAYDRQAASACRVAAVDMIHRHALVAAVEHVAIYDFIHGLDAAVIWRGQ